MAGINLTRTSQSFFSIRVPSEVLPIKKNSNCDNNCDNNESKSHNNNNNNNNSNNNNNKKKQRGS